MLTDKLAVIFLVFCLALTGCGSPVIVEGDPPDDLSYSQPDESAGQSSEEVPDTSSGEESDMSSGSSADASSDSTSDSSSDPSSGSSSYTPPEGTSYTHLEPDEAADMIAKGDCVIVDVRGEPQYDLEHIPGAICITYDSEDEDFTSALPDKDADILLYCDYGGISKETAERLSGELGYTHVYEFDGLLVWEGETESNLK